MAAPSPAPRVQAPSPSSGPGGPVSARQALQQIARACVQQIQDNEPRLMRSRSPEALHQIRVALRRWRTALSMFGPTLGPGQGRTQATLQWLAGELNEARDLDVFAAALTLSRGQDAGAEALWAALEAARAKAYAQADEALQSDRVRRLLWRTAQVGRPAANDEEGPEARQLAAAALEHRWRRLKRRGRKMQRLDPQSLHRLRIQAKKARYGCELCAEMFGHPRRQARMAKALKGLQESLGQLNDLAVGEALALRLAREAGEPEAAFAAGRLAGSRALRERAPVLKNARRAYKDFCATTRFWADALGA